MKINIGNPVQWRGIRTYTPHVSRLVVMVLGSSLLCLSSGLTMGIRAVLLPQLMDDKLVFWEIGYGSWIAATAPISSILGSLAIGTILDRLGRKKAHAFLTVPFTIGWLSMAFAHNFYVMLIGRIFTGFALGASRPTSVIYISEISNPKQRGTMLLVTSLALNLGVLFSHIIGTFLHWRTALLVCAVPNFMLLALIYFFKESPFWLISKGRIDEGIECFRWFRGEGEVVETELRAIIAYQKGKGLKLTFKELRNNMLSRGFVKPTIIMSLIFTTVHLSGVSAFPFYVNDLLESLFEEEVDTFYLTMIIDSVRVGVSVVICFFGKKMSRKEVFITCAYGTTLVLLVLVIYLIFPAEKTPLVSIPLTLVLFYTGISSAVSSLGWTFVGELYPTNVRGLGTGVSGAVYGILLSLCVKVAPVLLEIGDYVMYGTFSAITFLSAIILSYVLPETRGKRLQ